jgi:pimeloyl-ACP methyl ester carboxylesterase
MVKSALFLVPGLMCDASCWAQQRGALHDLADIHIPDNGARDSLVAMAEAIISAAPRRFALAGHSMGGRVALEVVRRVPERVQALALLDTGCQPLAAGDAGERERAGRLRLLKLAREQGMREMGRDWVRAMVHPSRLEDAPALIEAILDMIASKSADLYEAQIRALLERPDASDVLPQIRCPTLVLCGRDDGWAPARRHEDMAALIPGSTLHIIPDCGHMCTLERPAAVSQALQEWLIGSGVAA